jgi:hypothetical protein
MFKSMVVLVVSCKFLASLILEVVQFRYLLFYYLGWLRHDVVSSMEWKCTSYF